jgi:trehalose 6-phosphate synthase
MTPRADLILANRAFMDHEAPRWADSPTEAGNGGLLAAVRPVIQPWDGERGTTWIGAGRGRFDREWTDENGCELIETARGPLKHRRLYFSNATWQAHYGEVANSFFWPLLHLVREPLPERTGYYPAPTTPAIDDWNAYRAVNLAFAAAALDERTAETCWVHDYQLALVPEMLRRGQFGGRIGFFLHTPFPDHRLAARYLDAAGADAFAEFVTGLLGADLVGLQTEGDCDRLRLAATAICAATVESGGVRVGSRFVRIGAYPVGIDVQAVLAVAREALTPSRVTASRAAGLPLVVGLERADFTKGIPERLAAVAEVMRTVRPFAYLGIAAPTRQGVRAYEGLDGAIERVAAQARSAALEVGGWFSQVHAVVGWRDVVALQRDADVVFTSSLADGLNLVPLQAAIAQSVRAPNERAVIITGRDAGVASAFAGVEREGLVPVDPLDPAAMRHVLVEALAGRPGQISDRLVQEVRKRDALAWATRFLTDLEAGC